MSAQDRSLSLEEQLARKRSMEAHLGPSALAALDRMTTSGSFEIGAALDLLRGQGRQASSDDLHTYWSERGYYVVVEQRAAGRTKLDKSLRNP